MAALGRLRPQSLREVGWYAVIVGAPPMLLALLLAFSSSLMMSLTHYGTGTAPIIFGSGYTTLNEWWAAGAILSVVNLLVLVLVGSVWWKLLGYL